MADLLRRSLGERVEIETVGGGGLWRTEVDPAELALAQDDGAFHPGRSGADHQDIPIGIPGPREPFRMPSTTVFLAGGCILGTAEVVAGVSPRDATGIIDHRNERAIGNKNLLRTTGSKRSSGFFAGFTSAQNHDFAAIQVTEELFSELHRYRTDGNTTPGDPGRSADVFTDLK